MDRKSVLTSVFVLAVSVCSCAYSFWAWRSIVSMNRQTRENNEKALANIEAAKEARDRARADAKRREVEFLRRALERGEPVIVERDW